MNERTIAIAPIASAADVAAAKALVLEYADFLGEDLCFQGFADEMERFPASFELVLLARVGGDAAAVVGLKRFDASACEMKRLYARPELRGLRLGERLSLALVEAARMSGFETMRLDTLSRLEPAVALYRRLGFVEIRPYYANPMDNVLYMELDLRAGARRAG